MKKGGKVKGRSEWLNRRVKRRKGNQKIEHENDGKNWNKMEGNEKKERNDYGKWKLRNA